MLKAIVVILTFHVSVQRTCAQAVYELPFDSKANTIELAVVNTSRFPSEGLRVKAAHTPDWIIITNDVVSIGRLHEGEAKTASFSFSVEKNAPIRTKVNLVFVISGENDETWEKEISVEVEPPEKFELFQNFPNPFNPSTVISYQLVSESHVNISVFDLLGRKVDDVVDARRSAGFHRETWDASRVAGGLYVFRLEARDEAGEDIVAHRKLIVVK